MANIDPNASNSASQCADVLRVLKSGATLTAFDAAETLGIYRLAARVHEMRRQGVPIMSDLVQRQNRNGRLVWVSIYWIGRAE